MSRRSTRLHDQEDNATRIYTTGQLKRQARRQGREQYSPRKAARFQREWEASQEASRLREEERDKKERKLRKAYDDAVKARAHKDAIEAKIAQGQLPADARYAKVSDSQPRLNHFFRHTVNTDGHAANATIVPTVEQIYSIHSDRNRVVHLIEKHIASKVSMDLSLLPSTTGLMGFPPTYPQDTLATLTQLSNQDETWCIPPSLSPPNPSPHQEEKHPVASQRPSGGDATQPNQGPVPHLSRPADPAASLDLTRFSSSIGEDEWIRLAAEIEPILPRNITPAPGPVRLSENDVGALLPPSSTQYTSDISDQDLLALADEVHRT